MTDVRCAICAGPAPPGAGRYPNPVCATCDARALTNDGREPRTNTLYDGGDNPVFVDGQKCWRRYRFGGWYTMRDPWDCEDLDTFQERAGGIFGRPGPR